MNKINKIKLSGTTYDIQDLNATSVVNVTQAEYDALVTGGTVDPTTLYNITDAQAGDLSQYWTSAQTNSAITEAVSGKADTSYVDQSVSGKQDTLISGTNIKTINNESILGSGNIDIQGGGGSTYTASSGITIDSNNVIGLDGHFKIVSNNEAQFPSTVGDYIHIGYLGTNIGYTNAAKGMYTFAVGTSNIVGTGTYYGMNSMAVGNSNTTFNDNEFASGQNNVSSKASDTFGNSGNTLFSVGNGTADNARHNAFEIRQNGDIYISSGGTDIKLQDNLGSGGGGGGKAIEAGRGIEITTSESADTINCTVPASASSGNYSIMFGQPASSGDASGPKTITGGQWSKAFSEGAVSIGQMNEARGQWAWAIGNGTKTNGKAAFACGERTSANAQYAFSEGTETSANTQASHAAGSYTSTKNRSEFSIGEYNNSVSASTTFGDSGNTLFSVGNGTADNARHNAFEIRQNGDIYLNDGSKLQNTVSATASNTAALGGLKLVKLSQSEYDALATKDSNTLYIVTDS